MNCEQMTVLLSAWLDGELSVEEQQQMQAHLEQCPECRALFEQLQTLHTSFSDLEEIPAPEHFAQRVMTRIEAESKLKVVPLFKRPQVRSFAALAACAVLFVGFGRFALGGGSSKSEAAPAPEAAMYDLEEARAAAPESAGAQYQYSMEEPAECAPEMSEPESAVEAPAAPAAPAAPDVTVQTTQGEAQMDQYNKGLEDGLQNEGEIILHELPEGLEDVLGQLAWEERIEDGAQCARLTEEQAERLVELLNEQELSWDEAARGGETPQTWILVYLPN